MTAFPSLFLSHGGPNVVTDPSEARDFLKTLHTRFEKPNAIVMVSAHFEAPGPAVVFDESPDMIYDFGGFSPELYQMVYPAPGSSAVAQKVFSLLEADGLAPRKIAKRGFDHGAWNPLILGFPAADIPVVQVSIDPYKDAAWHYRLGSALSPLRDENIMIIGSGHITHNLRAVFSAMRSGINLDPEMAGKVEAFTSWFADTLENKKSKSLLNWRDEAPFVLDNHPTDEHLMPLFVAAGAAGPNADAERIHASRQYGFFAWDAWKFT